MPAEQILKAVGLGERLGNFPAQLSGGEQQRVAIARALATSPRVLLCDECTSALDPQTTLAILSLLKKVNRDLRVTIVLITHEMAVVKEICTRAAVLEHGQVAETGEVLSLFSAPQSEAGRRLTDAFGGKLAELRDAGWPILRQDASRRLALLRYPAESADEALISRVSREFSVDCNILFGNMWVCKGHYYSSGLSFYNFPYAFGGLFARGLFAQYKREGAAFVPRYKALLRATTVGTVEDTAALAGIDLTRPDFWRAGLQGVAEQIDRFLALVK